MHCGRPNLIPGSERFPGEEIGYQSSILGFLWWLPPAMQKTWVQSLGWEDPLEEGMTTPSSILAWRIPKDRRAPWASVYGVAESWTWPRDRRAGIIPDCISLAECWGSLWWKKVKSLSRVQLFMTPWTVAYQAPPSMGFSRQEYWSGLPFPSPGDLPNPGIELGSPTL